MELLRNLLLQQNVLPQKILPFKYNMNRWTITSYYKSWI